MIRALFVVGTRPEVIKLSPVVRALRQEPGTFEVALLAVRQHEGILDDALAEWGLSPDEALDLGPKGAPLGATLAAAVQALEGKIAARRPDVVIAQGDTTTAFAAALAAFYAGVPAAHVEAGLRSFDPGRPFPEETHRALIDRLAAVRYAPTERARQNLLAEGAAADSVVVVGNTGIDALFEARAGAPPPPRAGHRRLVVVTGHRRENFGEGTSAVCKALLSLVQSRGDVEIAYVLHTNPAARAPVCALLARQERIALLEPMGYRDFVALLDRSSIILTDSGGVQEEAPYLGKPVLVTRSLTERTETVELGGARLVGVDEHAIVRAIEELLDDEAHYGRMSRRAEPYGDGRAAPRIRADLTARFGGPG